MFEDSFGKSFTLSFDSWSTDRKTVTTQLDYQGVIGGAQIFNFPKYLLVTLRTAARISVPNKTENIAVFQNLNVRKDHVDIDGVRYPRDGVLVLIMDYMNTLTKIVILKYLIKSMLVKN